MDRRQRKTREAIFNAFTELLSKKHYSQITVGEIIENADIGRATFYSHFETKDFLLKDLCAELFDHLFYPERDSLQHNIFECDNKDSAFLHLFKHIKKNDNNIGKLLSSKNNELFLEYFKNGVQRLIIERLSDFAHKKPEIVPQEFWIRYLTATFLETLRWWLDNKMQQSPETITEYFLQSV